jgi:ferredoxin--NADP+ reductase
MDAAHARGVIPMMRAATELARQRDVPTLASLNPIMVDGNGVCDGCRVTVGDKVRLDCLDGSEIHAHKVGPHSTRSRMSQDSNRGAQAV